MVGDRSRNIIHQLFLLAQAVPPVSRARVAAALVYKNKFISYGFNQFKTHPLAAKFSKHPEANYLHAEVDCIRNAINLRGVDILKKSILYVARAKQTCTGDFIWGMSKPCLGCTAAIQTFQIPKVIYTTDTLDHICISHYEGE